MNLNLWCLNAYFPYEISDVNMDEFLFQLAIITDIIERHANCKVVLGGDFNVDFSRNKDHTLLLNDFCEQEHLFPLVKHPANTIDYTYQFNMSSFHVLHHFIVSGTLFEKAVQSK